MAELILILSDFFSVPAPRPDSSLPRLMRLERTLARARVMRLPAGWRAWLAARVGAAELSGEPPASVVAGARLSPADAPAYWLATPLQFIASLSSVQLHPAGPLTLSASEQQRLAEDFAHVFEDSPWRLHALGARELLLSGPRLEVRTTDPARWAGEDPSAGLAQGRDAAILRRLGVEIEMWLHAHSVNRERQASSQPRVSALWLWAGGAPAAQAAAHTAPRARLYAEDVYAESLWRLLGAQAQAPPGAFGPELTAEDRDSVVVLAASGELGLLEGFSQLEQRWLEPALEALHERRLSALWLLLGARAYRIRRFALVRRWRAIRPWWEALA